MTTIAWWPQDVNQYETTGTYHEKPDVNVVSFQPDVGPPKLRRRASVSTDVLSFSGFYTAAEYASLLTFYKTTLKDGTLPFMRTRRRTGATDAFVFAAPPETQDLRFSEWQSPISLRSVPGYSPGAVVVGGKDSFTKLLLHLNSSTGITDSIGNVVVASGGAAVSTAQYRFADAALSLDGAGDFLTITNAAAMRLGSGDFTVDFWIRLAAGGTNIAIIGNQHASLTSEWIIYIGATANCIAIFSAVNLFVDTANPLSLSTWHHVAWTRSGSTNYVFLDGAVIGSFTNSNNLSGTSSVIVGRDGGGGVADLNASLDEIRFSIGTARWTSGFLPGTEAYS